MKHPVFPADPLAPPERVPFGFRARQFFTIVYRVVFLALVTGLLYLTGLRVDAFVRQSDFFELREVRVVGATTALNVQVQDLLTTLRERGEDNLVTFNLERAVFQVRNLPRVREVTFRKIYPSTLGVEIEERQPLTVANLGDLYWIDREGVLLGRADMRDVAGQDIPLLTGLRGSGFHAGLQLEQPHLRDVLEAVEFLKNEDPELASRFAEWNLNANNEITGILREGVEVRFGEFHPLERLARLEALLRKKGDLEDTTYVDLRFETQIVYL